MEHIIAKNISEFRKKAGLTQEQLADKLGVTFQAVSKWENNQSCPDILLLPQIADIFGVSVDEIFGRTQTTPLTWQDDETVRGVVFIGHRLMSEKATKSRFTFEYKGQALNVESQCNIECGQIQGTANAKGDINCENLESNATAGGNINCASISGSATIGGNLNCSSIDGNVDCSGNVICSTINGDISCSGNVMR